MMASPNTMKGVCTVLAFREATSDATRRVEAYSAQGFFTDAYVEEVRSNSSYKSAAGITYLHSYIY